MGVIKTVTSQISKPHRPPKSRWSAPFIGRKETIMKSVYIKLITIEDVYSLVKTLLAFDGEVDLESGRYKVDGRSLLGIFSLDLTKPVKLIYHGAKAEELFAHLDRFVVENPEA